MKVLDTGRAVFHPWFLYAARRLDATEAASPRHTLSAQDTSHKTRVQPHRTHTLFLLCESHDSVYTYFTEYCMCVTVWAPWSVLGPV